jgi:hypothetical protein
MEIANRGTRILVAITAALVTSLLAVFVLGYYVPLLVLKIRFGFGDDDIPMGYGFDGLLVLAISALVGVIAASFLSSRFYRRLTPLPRCRPDGDVK